MPSSPRHRCERGAVLSSWQKTSAVSACETSAASSRFFSCPEISRKPFSSPLTTESSASSPSGSFKVHNAFAAAKPDLRKPRHPRAAFSGSEQSLCSSSRPGSSPSQLELRRNLIIQHSVQRRNVRFMHADQSHRLHTACTRVSGFLSCSGLGNNRPCLVLQRNQRRSLC